MTRFEADIPRKLARALAKGTAEWMPASEGGVRGVIRSTGDNRILAQPVLTPVTDGGNAGPAVAAAVVAVGTGAVWIAERRNRKRLDRQIAELHRQLEAKTAELENARGAHRTEVEQDLHDTRGKIIDLEEKRTQRTAPPRAAG